MRFILDKNKQIAMLESLIDHLKTELSYLNQLLVECGFTNGIETLKQSAEEMLRGFSF